MARKRQDTQADVPREAGGKWAKGVSPNPGGQPKWVRDVREALREDAKVARALLRSVLEDEDADMGHRIKAAEVVLRYTVPAPKQEVEVSGSVAGVAALDAETLRKLAQGTT